MFWTLIILQRANLRKLAKTVQMLMYVDKRDTKSGLGDHIMNNPGHKIYFQDTKVIDGENKTIQRKK